MTIVSGYAQIMAATENADERAQYVEQILRQFEQMAAMTREVLAFARGESNVLIRKVYLHQFIEDVRSYLTHAFGDKGIQIVVDAAYNGVAFFDEHKFMRVVHNIARNAFQAMGERGSFRFSIRKEHEQLVFEFADTGPGIPSEMEGRLFELFATSGKKEGSGLGLAIVKKIVDEHKGTITYRSTAGQGTTFVITLPLEKSASYDTGKVKALRVDASGQPEQMVPAEEGRRPLKAG
jgi:signal transduction histidine kinase